MTIKEFSHKHASVFFWATIVLAVLLIISTCGRMHGGRGYMKMKSHYGDERGFNRQGGQMIRGGDQRQMMDPNNPNQPIINDTPGAAGTVETGTQADPNVPLEVQ